MDGREFKTKEYNIYVPIGIDTDANTLMQMHGMLRKNAKEIEVLSYVNGIHYRVVAWDQPSYHGNIVAQVQFAKDYVHENTTYTEEVL